MHYMLVNLLHGHYIQHVMYVITYPLHAFEDANAEDLKSIKIFSGGYLPIIEIFKTPQPKREMRAFMPRRGRRPTTLKLSKSCSTSL